METIVRHCPLFVLRCRLSLRLALESGARVWLSHLAPLNVARQCHRAALNVHSL